MENIFLYIMSAIIVFIGWYGFPFLFVYSVGFFTSFMDNMRRGEWKKLIIGLAVHGILVFGFCWCFGFFGLRSSSAPRYHSAPSLQYTPVSTKPARYYDENSEEEEEEEEEERSDEGIFEEEDDYPPDIPGVYESYGRTVRVVEVRHSRWTEPDYRVEEIDEDYDICDHIRR